MIEVWLFIGLNLYISDHCNAIFHRKHIIVKSFPCRSGIISFWLGGQIWHWRTLYILVLILDCTFGRYSSEFSKDMCWVIQYWSSASVNGLEVCCNTRVRIQCSGVIQIDTFRGWNYFSLILQTEYTSIPPGSILNPLYCYLDLTQH